MHNKIKVLISWAKNNVTEIYWKSVSLKLSV